ncbi:MAG: hypothetical protein ACXQTI_09860 [Candidatus Nezhaarchaeales archaeon]
MTKSDLDNALRKVQEKTLDYIMNLVKPEELIDVNISLSFEEGTLNVDIQILLHEASTKNPTEIARRAAQYAVNVFDELWRKDHEVNEHAKTHQAS